MFEYISRIIEDELDLALRSSGAVLIVGPKWCGKTSTAEIKSNSKIYMQNPDQFASNIKIANIKPSLLLEGETPRLIDEWQVAPNLWDSVRYTVDRRGGVGHFILTGSAVPTDNKTMHTGTGRISRIVMRPMSLYESKNSNGSVSLGKVFEEKSLEASVSELDIEDYAYLICRGGWPASVGTNEEIAIRRTSDYINAVVNYDVAAVDGVEKNPNKVEQLLKSLSRNICTSASIPTIIKDVLGSEETISENTVKSYMNALQRIFVIENLPAWSPSLRSKTAIRNSPKRLFVDPSLATASLGMTKDAVMKDFNFFGFLFEALCIRDLRIYAQSMGGKVFHYRDKNDFEIDAIVSLKDGTWGAIEIKLGDYEVDDAARNLLKLREIIDSTKMKNPSFLMVLTGTRYSYKREDGVLVVPVGCLKN